MKSVFYLEDKMMEKKNESMKLSEDEKEDAWEAAMILWFQYGQINSVAYYYHMIIDSADEEEFE
jgi:hypothetical protein